jgi:hypothetical protein
MKTAQLAAFVITCKHKKIHTNSNEKPTVSQFSLMSEFEHTTQSIFMELLQNTPKPNRYCMINSRHLITKVALIAIAA